MAKIVQVAQGEETPNVLDNDKVDWALQLFMKLSKLFLKILR